MFTKKHYINIISVLLLLVVNIKFLADYVYPRGYSPLVFILVFLFLFVGLIYFQDKAFKPGESIGSRNFVYVFLILILASLAFDFAYNSGRGTSYFTSFNWLSSLGNGTYPYNNKAYHYNLPFLYYLDAPFYILGDIRIVGLFGLGMLFLILPGFSLTKKELVIRTSAVLILPLIYYEITLGGDALTNFTLVIAVMLLMKRFLDPDRLDIKFVFFGIVFGTLLCTRLLVVIPFMLSVLFFFRYNIKNLLLFVLLSLLICLAVFVPFFRWDYSAFILFGPFTNNFATLPLWIYILLFIAVLYAGWMLSDIQELLFASGFILFFVSIILGRNEASISELVVTVPFLILSLKEYRIDKFAGKQLSIR